MVATMTRDEEYDLLSEALEDDPTALEDEDLRDLIYELSLDK